jgi:beta-N-acetylhexosaminidase
LNETQARQAVGQIFCLRFPADWEVIDLKKYPVANYIVFRDVLESTFEGSREKLAGARADLRERGIEPLFMMDEEGGRVTQISDFFPSAPSPRAIAKTLLPEETGPIYSHLAHQLCSLGIDINLAPCLDVNTESMNPIIGSRAFGRTAKAVSLYGLTAFMSSRPYTAMVGKHFPGHGMTSTDSHLELPMVDTDLRTIESTHLPPFADACGMGIDGVMMSHCNYVALQDDKTPATLSSQVVGDMLRGRLGYRRLVITDSLDMDAIIRTTDPERAAILAHGAGCDISLYTRYTPRFEKSFDSFVAAVLSGDIDRQRLDASLARRRALCKRMRSCTARAASISREVYDALRDRVLAESVMVNDRNRHLPLECERLRLVSTHSEVRARIRPHVGSVSEACSPSDAGGGALLLWLMEPLKISYSLECMKKAIAGSDVSVLVTSYHALAGLLPGCDVKITTLDTSPPTQDRILELLFGQKG